MAAIGDARLAGWRDRSIALMVCLALALGGCGAGAAPPTGPTAWQVLTADGEERRLEAGPAPGAPGLAETEARARAARYVPGAPGATAAEARYVAVTLTGEQSTVLLSSRPVWLVTYVGVPFVTERCACHGSPERANTLVALDGASGELVLLSGSDGR
jgi:hypothetical protein